MLKKGKPVPGRACETRRQKFLHEYFWWSGANVKVT
jgi:hypothetical protein